MAIAALSIPVTVFVLKQQVDIRQHAAESGCPNYPTGGTNSCVPLSYFSQCPAGSTHYSSPDGDAACTQWIGQESMCCFAPDAPTPTPQMSSQTCDQKYGAGYQCVDAFSSTCAPPNLQQSAIGTTCNTGGAYACCKVVAGPPQGPRVMGANRTCSNNQISISFSAAPVPNATSYHLIYGWGSYTNGQQQISSSQPNFSISGFAPNLSIFYDVEACNAQGCTLDPNGYFGPISTGESCAPPVTSSCDQKYGAGYQCLTTSATECQSGIKQSTVGTDCSDSSGFQVACCKAATPTPTPYYQSTPTPANTLLSCDQKYGYGYQCLTTSATECQSGTRQNTVGTNCSDTAGFDVACCKAAAPTPTPYSQPTPTPTTSLLSCDQKYGAGYQCLTTSSTECQSGIQQNTVGTDCSDTAGFDMACCKAAAPTVAPSNSSSNTSTTSQSSPTSTCAQKYGSGYQCVIASTDECKAGIQKDPTGTDCDNSGGFQMMCCKAGNTQVTATNASTTSQTNPSTTCAQKYGTGYECLTTLANACTTGTQQNTVGTNCSDSSGFDVACCKAAAPIDCSSKGGRCINGLSQSCSDTEEVYTTGTTSCATTSQLCCVPKPIIPGASGPSEKQYIYFKSEGWTCVDNVIFNLSSGNAKYDPTQKFNFLNPPRLDPNAIDCKAKGQECKVVGAGNFESYTCLDNSTNDKKNIDERENATNHCGTGNDSNKIYNLGIIETGEKDSSGNPKTEWTFNKFLKDCAAEGKVCTQVGLVAICNDRPLENVTVHPPTNRADDPSSGINQGENGKNYVNMIADKDGWYPKGSAACRNNILSGPFIKEEDCGKENKVCTEIDQKVKCADPIVVDNTTIEHLYCGDGTNIPMPFSLKNLIIDTAYQYIKDKTGVSYAELIVNRDFEEASRQDIISYSHGQYTQLVGYELEERLASKGVNKIIAQQVSEHIFGTATYIISPADVALVYDATKTFVSAAFAGVKYDYWTCNGDKMEKRRIDVESGVASSEFRSCPDKGTACKIFDDRCVVCAKKQNTAYSSVQGAQTAQSCPLKAQGDANCDNKVNNSDLLIWRSEKLSGNGKTADFNNDGKVSLEDLDNYIPIN